MLQRFAGPTLVVAALSLLCAGPVAACVCTDEPMPAMPCCPDEPTPAQHADDACAPQVATACATSPAEALIPSTPDFPQPVAIAAPPWLERVPFSPPGILTPEPYASPPIYLVTLRLRN